MKSTRRLLVEVNGRCVEATVTVEIPGLEHGDFLDPALVLQAAAHPLGTYNVASRHDATKVVRISPLAPH